MDHRAASEHLLDLAATERDAAWAQVFATRALAHATLASLLAPINKPQKGALRTNEHFPATFEYHGPPPPPTIWCSTDRDDMDPVVLYQGDSVARGYDLRD